MTSTTTTSGIGRGRRGGGLVAALAVLLLVPTTAAAGPAPAGHSAVDAQASRRAPVEGPDNPGVAWQTDIGYELAGRSHEDPFPVDDQGRVIVSGRITSDGPRKGEGYLNAFDATTGQPVWDSPHFGSDTSCHPVVTDDGRVLVQLDPGGVAHPGPDAPLIAIDAATGVPIPGQSFTQEENPGRLAPCRSRLVLAGELVLLTFGGAQGGVRAIDISSTPWTEAWYRELQTDSGDDIGSGHNKQLVVNRAGDTFYQVSIRDRTADPDVWQVSALRVSDGTVRHRRNLPGGSAANHLKRLVAVDGGVVVALQGCDGERVNNQTGCVAGYTDNGTTLSQAWVSRPTDAEGTRQTVSTLTDTGAGVIAGWTLGIGRIYGLSLADGRLAFRHNPSSFSNNGGQLIADADGTLVHGAFGGNYLEALDADGHAVFAIPGCATSSETLRLGEPATVGGIAPDGTVVTGNHADIVDDGARVDRTYVLLGLRDGSNAAAGDCPAAEERVAGLNRIETAIEVSQASFPRQDSAETVVLAVASNYPDALAGGPLARAEDAPLLLTEQDGLNADTRAEIQRLGATRAILLGGTAALSPAVESALVDMGLDTDRIAGADRFDTARLISRRVPATTVYVTEGANPLPTRGWPDAVAVSGLAAFEQRPILLVTRDAAPAATLEALQELDATDVVVVGGTAAVSAATEAALADYVPGGADEADVVREAGLTRFDTSVRIARRSVAAGAMTTDLWFATGLAFPDALTAGPAVARSGGVLVLVDGQNPDGGAEVYDYLSELTSADVHEVWFVGGTAAISDAVADRIARALGIG